MNLHNAVARNYSAESENRIHSDGAAQTFGFDAALVPGVAVFGHMTRPLVESLGADWLGGYSVTSGSSSPPTTATNSRSSTRSGTANTWCAARAGAS